MNAATLKGLEPTSVTKSNCWTRLELPGPTPPSVPIVAHGRMLLLPLVLNRLAPAPKVVIRTLLSAVLKLAFTPTVPPGTKPRVAPVLRVRVPMFTMAVAFRPVPLVWLKKLAPLPMLRVPMLSDEFAFGVLLPRKLKVALFRVRFAAPDPDCKRPVRLMPPVELPA